MQQIRAVAAFLQMAILVIGTHTKNTTTVTEQPAPPIKCFHQPFSACNATGCRYLNNLQDTAVCCHLKQFQFKERMAGKCGLRVLCVTQSTKKNIEYSDSCLPRVLNSARRSDVISCFSSAPAGARCNYMEQSIFLKSWWSYSFLFRYSTSFMMRRFISVTTRFYGLSQLNPVLCPNIILLSALKTRHFTFSYQYFVRVSHFSDCLCGLVIRVPGYRSRGPSSIPGATRCCEKQWIWNGVHWAPV
jgi:hypothetical protein